MSWSRTVACYQCNINQSLRINDAPAKEICFPFVDRHNSNSAACFRLEHSTMCATYVVHLKGDKQRLTQDECSLLKLVI